MKKAKLKRLAVGACHQDSKLAIGFKSKRLRAALLQRGVVQRATGLSIPNGNCADAVLSWPCSILATRRDQRLVIRRERQGLDFIRVLGGPVEKFFAGCNLVDLQILTAAKKIC